MDYIRNLFDLKPLLLVLALLTASCAEAETFVEGRHYQLLDSPTITSNPSKSAKFILTPWQGGLVLIGQCDPDPPCFSSETAYVVFFEVQGAACGL